MVDKTFTKPKSGGVWNLYGFVIWKVFDYVFIDCCCSLNLVEKKGFIFQPAELLTFKREKVASRNPGAPGSRGLPHKQWLREIPGHRQALQETALLDPLPCGEQMFRKKVTVLTG